MAVDLTLLRKQVRERNERYREVARRLRAGACNVGVFEPAATDLMDAAGAIEVLLAEQEHAHATMERLMADSRAALDKVKELLDA